MCGRPRNRERTTRHHNQHDRLAGRDERFEKFFLIARKIDRRARRGLARHLASFTQDGDDHVGIIDCDAISNDLANCDAFLRLPLRRPRPEHVVFRIGERADDGDFPSRLRQRKQIIVVLQ